MIPIKPHLKSYRGAKQILQKKMADHNAMAKKIADYVNTLIANNPAEVQQYMFASIAIELGTDVDLVRSAISAGGYNGITIGVSADDRRALENYKK